MAALLIVVASVALALHLGAPRVVEATTTRVLAEKRLGTPSPADSLEARRLAADAVQRFLQSWRKAWLASEGARLRLVSDTAPRSLHAHCHTVSTAISSANRGFAKCPSWLLINGSPPVDQADALDGGISVSARHDVQSGRAQLLVTLATLRRRAPGDVFIVGQLVRFLVDAGRKDEALRAATDCSTDLVWCAALRGYALASRGQVAAADSAFERVVALLPPVSRCEWTDIAVLLPPRDAREGYRTRPCAVRDSLARQYWWTARPLLHEATGPHVRRVEHYRRKVLVLLHASLPFDEFHDLRPSHGGDAVAELLHRYGWPTLTAWAGLGVDTIHSYTLRNYKAPPVPPYTTAEYSSGRVHFAADWPAVLDPFRADTLAWQLRPPAGRHDNNAGALWWPVEHMRFPGAMVMQLPAGQTGFFRRLRTLRVLTVVETGDALHGGNGESPRAALVASSAPDSVTIIAESSVSGSGRVELSGEASARPMLLGIESTGTPSHPLVARTRFGAVPPPPLDSLPRGEIAVSMPVFFDAASPQGQPRDLDALPGVMLGGMAVPQGGKVGLFWETYGAAASDSVRYTVQVSRMESVGLLQRLGALLQVLKLPVASVAVAWQGAERPAPDAAGSPAPSAVPIAAGSIVLDLASLSRGTYMIEVTATVAGRPESRSGRVLTIR